MLMIQSMQIIINRVIELVALFMLALDQVTGVAGVMPFIPVLEAAKMAGTTILATKMINPLTI